MIFERVSVLKLKLRRSEFREKKSHFLSVPKNYAFAICSVLACKYLPFMVINI